MNYVGVFVKTYYCCMIPDCHKSYASKFNLRRHVRNKHQKIKIIRCHKCKRTFSSNQNLKEHMNIHLGIRPFECSVCGKEFRQSSQLSIHRRIHKVESLESQDFLATSLLSEGTNTCTGTTCSLSTSSFSSSTHENSSFPVKHFLELDEPLTLPALRKHNVEFK